MTIECWVIQAWSVGGLPTRFAALVISSESLRGIHCSGCAATLSALSCESVWYSKKVALCCNFTHSVSTIRHKNTRCMFCLFFVSASRQTCQVFRKSLRKGCRLRSATMLRFYKGVPSDEGTRPQQRAALKHPERDVLSSTSPAAIPNRMSSVVLPRIPAPYT